MAGKLMAGGPHVHRALFWDIFGRPPLSAEELNEWYYSEQGKAARDEVRRQLPDLKWC
jgi:hypothetical protein